MKNQKSEKIKGIVKSIVNEEIDLPNDAMVFLDPSTLIEIFTKKRLELISLIIKFKPKSIQGLADIAERKKQAVDRDLKILERLDLVKLEKKGRSISPKIEKRLILMNLSELFSIGDPKVKKSKEGAIEAQVFVDGVNINKKMGKKEA